MSSKSQWWKSRGFRSGIFVAHLSCFLRLNVLLPEWLLMQSKTTLETWSAAPSFWRCRICLCSAKGNVMGWDYEVLVRINVTWFWYLPRKKKKAQWCVDNDAMVVHRCPHRNLLLLQAYLVNFIGILFIRNFCISHSFWRRNAPFQWAKSVEQKFHADEAGQWTTDTICKLWHSCLNTWVVCELGCYTA